MHAKNEEKEQCKNCRYWVSGECRRHAPVIPIEGELAGMDSQPNTYKDYWCGDFEISSEHAHELFQQFQLIETKYNR
ncbi:MAG: hypothetical protein GY696_29180 [Gammaproteobacteria bacterium]|nr:hypothetical protein [Gammaproteobacteria bacterium]